MPPFIRNACPQQSRASLRSATGYRSIYREDGARRFTQSVPFVQESAEGISVSTDPFTSHMSRSKRCEASSPLLPKHPFSFQRSENSFSFRTRSDGSRKTSHRTDRGNSKRREDKKSFFSSQYIPLASSFPPASPFSVLLPAGCVGLSSSARGYENLVHRSRRRFYRTYQPSEVHANNSSSLEEKQPFLDGPLESSSVSQSEKKKATEDIPENERKFLTSHAYGSPGKENPRYYPRSVLFSRVFQSSSESSRQRESDDDQTTFSASSFERGLITLGDEDSEGRENSTYTKEGREESTYPFSWLFRPSTFLGAIAAGTASLCFSFSASSSSSSSKPPSSSFSSRFFPHFFRRHHRGPSSCCGIVAYVGDKEAEPLLMEGLEILQNRGYDSCGISSISPEGRLITTKFASRGTTCDSIEILKRESKLPHKGNKIGIAHTRWATHGSKTDENAHPHHDWKNRISLVHNGTIDNYAVLKKALISRGCTFRSQTDSEVIANLIGWYLDQPVDDDDDEMEEGGDRSSSKGGKGEKQRNNALEGIEKSISGNLNHNNKQRGDVESGSDPARRTVAEIDETTPDGEENVVMVVEENLGPLKGEGSKNKKTLSFEEAVKRAVGELQGTWGLCILHKDYPDRLILARNGSPLLVGAAGGQVFVASEPAALAQHTNQYLMLRDGEIAVVTPRGIGQLEASGRTVHRISQEMKTETSPSPFLHWTVKEIFEQPQALGRAMNNGGRIAPYKSRVKLGGLDQNRDTLLEIKNLLICGCGTSLYAGMYGELLMQWLRCFDQVRAVDASEVDLHQFPKSEAGMLLLSQSGETLDTVRACQLADVQGVKKFSVVNQVGSLLARMTNCGVYVNAGREVAVASTKAFSSQVWTSVRMYAIWLSSEVIGV